MSDRKIVDYEFVVDGYAIDFSESVRHKLNQGYSLYGNPVMTVDSFGLYCNGQAMVKYEDEK